MDIYVDKLPESCKECKFSRHSALQGLVICDASGLGLPNYKFITGRDKTCPLKELTNAQLAVGWYQEGKRVTSPLQNYTSGYSDLIKDASIENLINAVWKIKEEEEKPKFYFTDWKGAREAVKVGKKVSIDWVTQNMENVELCHSKSNSTFWILVGKHKWNLSDELYDSTKWKVGE